MTIAIIIIAAIWAVLIWFQQFNIRIAEEEKK